MDGRVTVPTRVRRIPKLVVLNPVDDYHLPSSVYILRVLQSLDDTTLHALAQDRLVHEIALESSIDEWRERPVLKSGGLNE